MVTQGTIHGMSSSEDLEAHFWSTAHFPELEEILENDTSDVGDIINLRNDYCASLRQLRLTDCRGLTLDRVGVLEEVVEDVDWVGYEEPLESGTGLGGV